jgi:hypothetical protein
MECIFLMFLDHTQRRSTVDRTPLDERSARRRDLYLRTHDAHNRQISMSPVGVKPTISVNERPQAAHLLRSWVDIHVSSCWQHHPYCERAIRLVYPPFFCTLRSSYRPTNKTLVELGLDIQTVLYR